MLITIITPTIGSYYLKKLLQSLNQQNGLNEKFTIEHFIVIDNADTNKTKVNTILNEVFETKGIKRYIFNIPFASGSNNFKGHKIYSAIPQFANGEYTIFLDDDNFLFEDHISHFIQLISQKNYDWCYSLRTIIDKNDKVICKDHCESLGFLSNVYYNPNSYLIDTNCYFVKSQIVKDICHIWNRNAQYNDNDPDRMFGRILMSNFLNYGCTKKYTLGYRVEEDGKGVSSELFKKGNSEIYKIYGSVEVWKRPTIFLAHFNQTQTNRMIQRIYQKDKESIAFKQWQLNLFDDLHDKLHIKNAYTSPFIPKDSIVWVHMCHLQELPQQLLQRKDIHKILYTIESPNIRHQAQWDNKFLNDHFDIILTYWTDLFKVRDSNTIYFPFVHRLNMKNENDLKEICNGKKDPSACILLENRDLRGKYKINDSELEAQDYKRKIIVQNIASSLKVYCYGSSWKTLQNKNIIQQDTPSRFTDQDKTTDYYNKHTFSIIIENCNANGYVSEKIYDAWMASSIPIYSGNFNSHLQQFIGTDIPIDKMMINVDKIGVENIGKYIEDLYMDEIEELVENINKYKHIVLERVGISSYNQKVLEIVQTIHDS